jgi:uncharacterized protein YbjT (DUF2867 family)
MLPVCPILVVLARSACGGSDIFRQAIAGREQDLRQDPRSHSMILVTEPTRTTSRELVTRLVQRGRAVRALVSSQLAADDLAGPEVEVMRADLSDRRAIDAAMAGVGRVFLVATSAASLLSQRELVIDAAARAGVRRVVALAAVGDAPSTLEERATAAGMDWTELRAHLGMQSLLALAPELGAGTLHAPLGDARLPIIDLRDVADVAASVLLEPGHAGKRYELSGPEALGLSEVAAVLSRVLDRELAYQPVTPEEAYRLWLDAGIGEPLARELELAFRLGRAAAGSAPNAVVQALLERAPRSFAETARDYASLVRRVSAAPHSSLPAPIASPM